MFIDNHFSLKISQLSNPKFMVLYIYIYIYIENGSLNHEVTIFLNPWGNNCVIVSTKVSIHLWKGTGRPYGGKDLK
jgi:hypothetical protein